jgi:hypothetical protein
MPSFRVSDYPSNNDPPTLSRLITRHPNRIQRAPVNRQPGMNKVMKFTCGTQAILFVVINHHSLKCACLAARRLSQCLPVTDEGE